MPPHKLLQSKDTELAYDVSATLEWLAEAYISLCHVIISRLIR